MRILFILLGLFVVINVNAETLTTTESIGTPTVLIGQGTATQATTTITTKEERIQPICALQLPILGRTYKAHIFYVASLRKYEVIIYLEDSEVVAFFDMPDEWRKAITVRLYQMIDKGLLTRTNCAEVINKLEELKKGD